MPPCHNLYFCGSRFAMKLEMKASIRVRIPFAFQIESPRVAFADFAWSTKTGAKNDLETTSHRFPQQILKSGDSPSRDGLRYSNE